MKKKARPSHGIFSNVSWMLGNAWRVCKTVPLWCVVHALLVVGLNLAELFVAPEILGKVESSAPVSELVATIAVFAGLLFLLNGGRKYVEGVSEWGRIDVRFDILGQIEKKNCTTSYPNTLDPDVIKLRNNAQATASGNDRECEAIWLTLRSLLANIGGFVIYLMLLSNLDPVLLCVVIATAVASFFASRWANTWQHAHRDDVQDYWRKQDYINTKSTSVTLAKDIRMFGMQEWILGLQDKLTRFYAAWALRVEKHRFVAYGTDIVLGIARNAVAYLYLINMALNEGMSASEFLLYFTAVSGFTAWITGILKEFSDLHHASLEICNVRDYLELPETFRMVGGKSISTAHGYELQLKNVSFRYPGTEEDTLKNVDLTVKPGERLAIVGLNGAGKTTLVKLICGLFDPTEGAVLLNGQDIRQFNRPDYYRLFASVFQDMSVLDVTIAENVAQTSENIDRARVKACLAQAGLTEKIASLPDGIDTHVGREVWEDGVLFSGGETQRLMLARALYRSSPILMLDEPTAALDPIAENDIYMKYNEMTAGRTAMFISHRLASTRFCDRIIFIADGGIAEEGTHASLLEKNGRYAELFEVQSRYYREGRDF